MSSHLNIFKLRPISPSNLSLWNDTRRDPDHKKWADRYILGLPSVFTKEEQARMDFGTAIHEKIALQPRWRKDIPRLDAFEETIDVRYKDIPLTGKMDTLGVGLDTFADYKTTASRTWWTQSQCDKHDQFTMYFALLWLRFKIDPKDISCKAVIIYVDDTGTKRKLTREKCVLFEVRKTKVQVLEFLGRVEKTHSKMCTFVKEYK